MKLLKMGICREASSNFHNSTPCSSKYMHGQMKLLQGGRAIVELSCKGITAMCLRLLTGQTCFHKLAGLLNQSNKGLCLQRKQRLLVELIQNKCSKRNEQALVCKAVPRRLGQSQNRCARSWAGNLVRA